MELLGEAEAEGAVAGMASVSTRARFHAILLRRLQERFPPKGGTVATDSSLPPGIVAGAEAGAAEAEVISRSFTKHFPARPSRAFWTPPEELVATEPTEAEPGLLGLAATAAPAGLSPR